MKPRLFSLSFLLAALIISCSSPKPIQVMHVREMEASAGHTGFYYALPRTILSIDVTVTKNKEIPGPFANYSESLLGITDIIRNQSVSYELTDITISSYAEPDPTQFYFVKYDPQDHIDKPLYITLTESGLIKSVNMPFDKDRFLSDLEEKDEYGYFGTEATFNHFIDPNMVEKIDTILQMVVKDTIIVERQILESSWVRKGPEARAQEVADFILKLRNQKMDLISGFQEIPYSKETIEYMYEEIKEIENNYLELFTGITSRNRIKYRFTYLPDKLSAGRKRAIFRFCHQEGLLPASNNDKGTAVFLQLQRHETTRQPEVFIRRNIAPQKTTYGFYYRIPEHANATIKKNDIIKADARVLISQFGTITSLPPVNLQIEFYPNTGFIRSVKKIKE